MSYKLPIAQNSELISPLLGCLLGESITFFAEKRFFIDLDSVNSSYLINKAWVATDDFEIEIEFTKLADTTLILIGRNDVTTDFISNLAGNNFRLRITSNLPDVVFTNADDGKLHKIRYRRISGSIQTFFDGVLKATDTNTNTITLDEIGANSGGNFWDGVISSVKLTDLSTPSNNFEFSLNESTRDFELPIGNEFSTNKISNGTFDTDLTDWTAVGTGTISFDASRMKVTRGSSGNEEGQQTITTVIGNVYLVEWFIHPDSDTSSAARKVQAGGVDIFAFNSNTGNFKTIFVATATSTLMAFIQGGGSGKIGYFDNIVIREVTNAVTYNNIPTSDRFEYQLQSNGNFLSVDELVTNGGFDADTDWTKEAGWTIANGRASLDTTSFSTSIDQSSVIVVGLTYQTSYEVLDFVAGSGIITFGSGSDGTTRTADGVYTEVLPIATGTTLQLLNLTPTSEYSVDNISVKRILEKA